MNRKQLVVAVIVILLITVALAASLGTFLATVPTKEATYTAPASAVRVPLSTTATSDTIALRLNSVSDTSNTTARDVWAKLNNESANVTYRMSLTPSPGERYLIANITVTNVRPTNVHFSDTAFAVLTANNTAYYSNYAVCNQNCSRALENRTLSAGFTSDLYVLFAVPAGTTADKVVYTTSNPPIVMSAV
jgi:FlaG/FlaF family flagellin (archaellin)